jgi:SAM-dependent methyltransferase
VLDLGCGAGDPIARYLLSKNFRVAGVDFSEPMLAIARARFPEGRWLHADMRTLALDERFDGIVGWHSFFHLTPEEQRGVLARLALHLRPAGALMLTVGPGAGEVIGRVGDDPVYHSSLEPQEYVALLGAGGVEVVSFVAEDATCGGATVLLARKQATP